MSVIETPPEDRLPIQTRVAEASAGLVRDAILRELDRGGQVFYVHNRVETIEAQADQLRRMLPGVRFVVGHGQMAEGSLEKVMIAFADGAADVLVCTTIIESGLDIPNANTIVIDRADTLGLAQLYQLRGRVGRSSRRAYAYLLYRRRERLSDEARKRGTWRRSASTCTRASWPTRSRRARRRWRAAPRSSRPRRPSSTCRSRRICPTTTFPTRRTSSSCTGAWRAPGPAATSPRSARRSSTATDRCPTPSSGWSRWPSSGSRPKRPASRRSRERKAGW